jgi:sugar lactone lactonase YvrE
MAFAATPNAGSLYRYDPDGTVTRALGEVTISNGIGWSANDRTMYYIDSTEGIDTFEFEPESGRISGRRRLVTIEPSVGLPDGMTVDATGHIWVAIWGGGRVRQYTPAGELKREIRLPVSQVTNVAFGGQDYADLYITSARVGLGADRLSQEPLAGACFVCRPGVQGIAPNRFAG